MKRSLLLVSLLTLSAMPLHAKQGQHQYITAEIIKRWQGHVPVSMGCNWLPDEHMATIGVYGSDENRREEPIHVGIAKNAEEKQSVLTIPPDQITDDLDGIRFEYRIDEKNRCKEGFGWNYFSK